MLEQMFKDPTAVQRWRTGLLGVHIESFVKAASDLGYSKSTIRTQLWPLGNLQRWLEKRSLGVADLTAPLVEHFLEGRRRRGRLHRNDACAVRLFLNHLQEQGIARIPEPMIDKSPLATLRRQYEDHLRRERALAPLTVTTYWHYLQCFLLERFGDGPISLHELTPRDVTSFLLRHARSRTPGVARLMVSSLRSFFRYVSFCEPGHVDLCSRVLAIPSKRYERAPIEYLTREEIDALVAAPDTTTWIGRRDQALLVVAIQTGLRVSELTGLQRKDVVLGTGAHVRCQGKGRKQRCTPLRREAVCIMKTWLAECPEQPESPVFMSRRGKPMSRDAVERMVTRHCRTAEHHSPSLKRKRVTPHVLRHTAAMELLRHGIDRSVIALWLGHESVESTQMYLHADLRLKEEALSRTLPLDIKTGRYRPDDKLLAFLEAL